MEYIEQDCTIEHEGRKFTSGGAAVNPKYAIGYLGKDFMLTDWHGKQIGVYRVRSTWRTPRSFVSSTMSSVEAIIDGIKYIGRSAGVGMVFKGKRAANQTA